MRVMGCSSIVRFCSQVCRTSLSTSPRVVHNLIMDVGDSYRPELHHMRGPGPKWRAKHHRWLKIRFSVSRTSGQAAPAVAAVRTPSRRG